MSGVNSWPVTISLPCGLTMGGVTTWAVQLADLLARRGRATRLVIHAAAAGHSELTLPVLAGTPAEIVRAPNLQDPANWSACVQLYRELLPTVLVPNLWTESFALGAALATTQPEALRVVAWHHTDHPLHYAQLGYYEPMIHAFVPVSRRTERKLVERVPSRRAALHYRPYGTLLGPEPRRGPLGGRPLRLVYAGRMTRFEKRVMDVLGLAECLLKRRVPFELRLVGDGPDQAEVAARVAELCTAYPGAALTLEPPVPPEAIGPVWAWADVCVLTSSHEGFPISALEAMAAGCVPVITDICGTCDILEPGVNGLTFAVGELESAADQVVWLTGAPERLPRMSAAARAAAATHCDMSGFLRDAEAILTAAAAAAPRPWPTDKPVHMASAAAARAAQSPATPLNACVPCCCG